LCSDSLGAFSDASKAPVTHSSALSQNFGIDARSIVANAHAQHVLIVPNFGLNPVSACVVKSISENFKGDSAYFIA
jgi:hypothetical protein